jgi:hypothetical protein
MTPATVNAQDADRWAGEYSGSSGCMLEATQCWLDIRLTGRKTYKVDLIVAEQLDDDKVKCKITGKSFSLDEDGALVGKWEGHPTRLIRDPTENEGITVSGQRWSDKMACGFLVAQEQFFMIGD